MCLTVIIPTRLTTEQADQLRSIAANLGTGKAAVLRLALRHFLMCPQTAALREGDHLNINPESVTE